jgi:esterase/lipase superfamily enzyme
MQREYQRWFSHALQRDMEMLVLGHAGDRVVAFPPATGRFYDLEDCGLLRSVSDRIERGYYQCFCVDSVDSESWHNSGPARARARRHEQYESYLLNEVVPFSEGHNPNSFLITAGDGFGGYHAVNFGLRHPDRVQRVLGMSGLHDIRRFTDGVLDDAVYFNNPCEFIAGERDPARLHALRRLEIILPSAGTIPRARATSAFPDNSGRRGLETPYASGTDSRTAGLPGGPCFPCISAGTIDGPTRVGRPHRSMHIYSVAPPEKIRKNDENRVHQF